MLWSLQTSRRPLLLTFPKRSPGRCFAYVSSSSSSSRSRSSSANQRKRPPLRIFTAGLSCEVNTFCPLPTDRSQFVLDPLCNPIQQALEVKNQELEEALEERRCGELPGGKQTGESQTESCIIIEQGIHAEAPPGGIVRRDTFEGLRDEIISQLTAAMPVDAVLLHLHGAQVAHGYEDAEGDVLSRVRKLVGPDVFVGAELDPHSHATPLRVESADVLVAYKEYVCLPPG